MARVFLLLFVLAFGCVVDAKAQTEMQAIHCPVSQFEAFFSHTTEEDAEAWRQEHCQERLARGLPGDRYLIYVFAGEEMIRLTSFGPYTEIMASELEADEAQLKQGLLSAQVRDLQLSSSFVDVLESDAIESFNADIEGWIRDRVIQARRDNQIRFSSVFARRAHIDDIYNHFEKVGIDCRGANAEDLRCDDDRLNPMGALIAQIQGNDPSVAHLQSGLPGYLLSREGTIALDLALAQTLIGRAPGSGEKRRWVADALTDGLSTRQEVSRLHRFYQSQFENADWLQGEQVDRYPDTLIKNQIDRAFGQRAALDPEEVSLALQIMGRQVTLAVLERDGLDRANVTGEVLSIIDLARAADILEAATGSQMALALAVVFREAIGEDVDLAVDSDELGAALVVELLIPETFETDDANIEDGMDALLAELNGWEPPTPNLTRADLVEWKQHGATHQEIDGLARISQSLIGIGPTQRAVKDASTVFRFRGQEEIPDWSAEEVRRLLDRIGKADRQMQLLHEYQENGLLNLPVETLESILEQGIPEGRDELRRQFETDLGRVACAGADSPCGDPPTEQQLREKGEEIVGETGEVSGEAAREAMDAAQAQSGAEPSGEPGSKGGGKHKGGGPVPLESMPMLEALTRLVAAYFGVDQSLLNQAALLAYMMDPGFMEDIADQLSQVNDVFGDDLNGLASDGLQVLKVIGPYADVIGATMDAAIDEGIEAAIEVLAEAAEEEFKDSVFDEISKTSGLPLSVIESGFGLDFKDFEMEDFQDYVEDAVEYTAYQEVQQALVRNGLPAGLAGPIVENDLEALEDALLEEAETRIVAAVSSELGVEPELVETMLTGSASDLLDAGLSETTERVLPPEFVGAVRGGNPDQIEQAFGDYVTRSLASKYGISPDKIRDAFEEDFLANGLETLREELVLQAETQGLECVAEALRGAADDSARRNCFEESTQALLEAAVEEMDSQLPRQAINDAINTALDTLSDADRLSDAALYDAFRRALEDELERELDSFPARVELALKGELDKYARAANLDDDTLDAVARGDFSSLRSVAEARASARVEDALEIAEDAEGLLAAIRERDVDAFKREVMPHVMALLNQQDISPELRDLLAAGRDSGWEGVADYLVEQHFSSALSAYPNARLLLEDAWTRGSLHLIAMETAQIMAEQHLPADMAAALKARDWSAAEAAMRQRALAPVEAQLRGELGLSGDALQALLTGEELTAFEDELFAVVGDHLIGVMAHKLGLTEQDLAVIAQGRFPTAEVLEQVGVVLLLLERAGVDVSPEAVAQWRTISPEQIARLIEVRLLTAETASDDLVPLLNALVAAQLQGEALTEEQLLQDGSVFLAASNQANAVFETFSLVARAAHQFYEIGEVSDEMINQIVLQRTLSGYTRLTPQERNIALSHLLVENLLIDENQFVGSAEETAEMILDVLRGQGVIQRGDPTALCRDSDLPECSEIVESAQVIETLDGEDKVAAFRNLQTDVIRAWLRYEARKHGVTEVDFVSLETGGIDAFLSAVMANALAEIVEDAMQHLEPDEDLVRVIRAGLEGGSLAAQATIRSSNPRLCSVLQADGATLEPCTISNLRTELSQRVKRAYLDFLNEGEVPEPLKEQITCVLERERTADCANLFPQSPFELMLSSVPAGHDPLLGDRQELASLVVAGNQRALADHVQSHIASVVHDRLGCKEDCSLANRVSRDFQNTGVSDDLANALTSDGRFSLATLREFARDEHMQAQMLEASELGDTSLAVNGVIDDFAPRQNVLLDSEEREALTEGMLTDALERAVREQAAD